MFSRIEEELVAALERLLSRLPAESYTMEVRRAPLIEHGGVSIWIFPTVRTSAPFVIDAMNGDLTISMRLGRTIPYEVYEPQLPKALQEIEAVCTAVIEGKFTEELFLVGDEVARAIGRVTISAREQIIRHRRLFYPFSKKQHCLISYSP